MDAFAFLIDLTKESYRIIFQAINTHVCTPNAELHIAESSTSSSHGKVSITQKA